MEFRLLRAAGGGRGRSLATAWWREQRSLLAVLLLHANEVVSSERLIDDLWGEAPPATVAKSVQVYLAAAQALGEGRLRHRTPGYVLRVDPSEVDTARFERLVAEARSARPERASEKLCDTLALWRASPLADLAYEPFAQEEIARLEELHLGVVEAPDRRRPRDRSSRRRVRRARGADRTASRA